MSGISVRLRRQIRRFFTAELKGLFKDSTWTALGSLATSGLYFVEIMLLTRYLSQELLGVYFIVLSFPEIVQEVLDIRVNDMMVRYLSLFIGRSEKEHAIALIELSWLADVIIATIALLIVIAFSPFASRYLLRSGEFASLMVLYGVGMFFASLDSASGSVLRVFKRFDLAFYGSLVVAVSRILFIAVSILADGGLRGLVMGRVLAFVVSTAVIGSLSLVIIRQYIGLQWVPLTALAEYRREMFQFALQINLASTIKVLAMKLDVIIVGRVLGPAATAVYKIATQLAKTLLIFSDPLIGAIYPRFALLAAQNNIQSLNGLVKRITLLMGGGAIVILTFTFSFRELLMVSFAGEQYRSQAMLFVIATIGMAFAMVFFWVRPYLLSLGLAAISTKSITLATILSLFGLGVFTQFLGLYGAMLGFSLFYILTILISLFQLFRWKRTHPISSTPSRKSIPLT